MFSSSFVGVRPPAGRRKDIGNVYVFVWGEHSIADIIFVSNSPVGPDRTMPVRSSSELGMSVMISSAGFSTPVPVMEFVANLDNGFRVNDFIFSLKSDNDVADLAIFSASVIAFMMDIPTVCWAEFESVFVEVGFSPDRACMKLFLISRKLWGVSP